MEPPFEVPDSTDWLNTPLSGLAQVDASLRCQVCKDFYTTPMITTCSHTFCSLCIRRCLAAEGRCPTCRGPDQELKLRRNGVVEELVDAFRAVRDSALTFAREASIHASGGRNRGTKRKLKDVERQEDGEHLATSARKTRSQSRNHVPVSHQEEVADSDESYEDVPTPDDGLVPCPMCGRRMKEESIWPHLDRCDKDRSHPTSPSHSKSPIPPSANHNLHSSEFNSQTRLPQLNYSLYRENALRKKLSELGIRASGPKPLLERRHTEWVNLWNANCDSNRPRSKKELLRELDVWERSQGGLAPGTQVGSGGVRNSTGASGSNAVMRKDFDGAGWAASHDVAFKDLIAMARQKRSGGKPKEDDKSAVEIHASTVANREAAADASDTMMSDPSVTEVDPWPNVTLNGRPPLHAWKESRRDVPEFGPRHPYTSPGKPTDTDISQDPIIDDDLDR